MRYGCIKAIVVRLISINYVIPCRLLLEFGKGVPPIMLILRSISAVAENAYIRIN